MSRSFSLAPEVPSLDLVLELTAPTPDPAPAPVSDTRLSELSSRPPASRSIAISLEPAQAGPSGVVPKRVSRTIVSSEKEDSGGGWHEAEGSKGNLSQRKVTLSISLGLTIPAAMMAVYYLLLQTYVLRVEVILNAILLVFYALEFILDIVALTAFARANTY
nr:PREDICTED: transmembrane protein 216 [Latimeria chalumnae]|eukprot:XP_014353047.1 PREDICTED: transmembrane protein 216 [Latimeria chalumnae]